MLSIAAEFDRFQQLWRSLPRRTHTLLPCRRDITPGVFGDLLHHMCLGERSSADHLKLIYAGSGFERNAGFAAMGVNYYDVVPEQFLSAIKRFHQNLFTAPCAAYVGDLVTSTMGNHYLHHTLHLPITDDSGNPCYLLVFGLDRKPASDLGDRLRDSVGESNIKDLAYLDLGAGTPSGYVSDFTLRPGKAGITTSHALCPLAMPT